MASSRHKPHPGRRTTKATAPAPPALAIWDARTSLAVTVSPALATGRDDTASVPIVIDLRAVERKSCFDSAAGTVVGPVELDVLMAIAAGEEDMAKTLADARAMTAAPVALQEASGRILRRATVVVAMAIVLVLTGLTELTVEPIRLMYSYYYCANSEVDDETVMSDEIENAWLKHGLPMIIAF